MNRFILARQADQDLDEISEYLATQNPEAAMRVLDAIHDTFVSLGELPNLGRSLDHLRPNLRCLPARSPANQYVIFYYPLKDGVEIATVIHGRRDWIALFLSGSR